MAVLRLWPFTCVGVLTLVVFLVAEVAQGSGISVEPLYDLLRIIIVPIWLMRYVIVAIGGLLFGFSQGAGLPTWYNILTLPIVLLPYVAADLTLIRTWRRPQSESTQAPRCRYLQR